MWLHCNLVYCYYSEFKDVSPPTVLFNPKQFALVCHVSMHSACIHLTDRATLFLKTGILNYYFYNWKITGTDFISCCKKEVLEAMEKTDNDLLLSQAEERF